MNESNIESTPPPAVKNLRSKFEQLASDNNAIKLPVSSSSSSTTRRPPSRDGSGLLAAPERIPRPRVPSNTYNPSPSTTNDRNITSSLTSTTISSQDTGNSFGGGHSRAASFSSDLGSGSRPLLLSVAQPGTAKRVPPPPPPRPSTANGNGNGIKVNQSPGRSPAASPMLNPVPVPSSSPRSGSGGRVNGVLVTSPPSALLSQGGIDVDEPLVLTSSLEVGYGTRRHKLSNSSASNGPASSPYLSPLGLPRQLTGEDVDEPQILGPSVSSLRDRFNTTISAPSPPKAPSPRRSSPHSGESSSHGSPTPSLQKPAIPPRPNRATEPPPPSVSPIQPQSSGEMSQPISSSATSSRTSLNSPFTDNYDAESSSSISLPPALPARKGRLHAQQTSESSLRSSSDTSSITSNHNEGFETKTLRLGVVPPPPPRPPQRQQAAVAPGDGSLSPIAPPPLPLRRITINTASPFDETSTSQGPPKLPARPTLTPVSAMPNASLRSPISTHVRSVSSGRLPPPPTRTIGLGNKLPPARRPPTPSSDEESGAEEEDTKLTAAYTLPDSSRAFRRPPTLSFRETYPDPRIAVTAYSGQAVITGNHLLVSSNHHLKVYDLSISDGPVRSLDGKDVGLKELKVTSMEVRPISQKVLRGCLVWVGTKDGHLLEVDVRTGQVTGTKFSAHLHAVMFIFRHGRSMVSIDESGKTLIFSPDDNREDISLGMTHPKIIRLSEKLDWAKMVGGKLWTASRAEQQGAGHAKIPVIKVYDVVNSQGIPKLVFPLEHVGPVTCAAVVPSDPTHIYVGHEEGFVSVWEAESAEDGFPVCVEVMKISTSDVLCLEGVNNRLWAGSRNGIISAYDVVPRPWVVTNAWVAHPGLPVLRMIADPWGIEKTGRLCVVSVGRDEQLKLWDGLLGADWIDAELSKQENSFTTTRDLTVLVVSWNVDAAKPDALTGDPANVNFLSDVLRSVDSPPDIISFGFQEVMDLENRKMAAKNVLLASSKKKGEDNALSDKVTSAYKKWHDRLVSAVRQNMPQDVSYTVMHTESLVGLFSCVFVKNSAKHAMKDGAITTIKRGMGGRYGNKGGIIVRLVIDDTSVCLINCHLAAGQGAVRQRNFDIAGMLEEKAVFPVGDQPFAYVGGGDGTMVMDHEIVFVNGDLNYRIDHRRDAIIAAIQSDDCETLHAHDQLLREIKYNRACRLRDFSEGPLNFMPTYKYDRRSNEYDSSEKRRSPAWCDRVLWRSRVPSRVQQLHYRRYEANVSDHRPISAAFKMTVKSMRYNVRERIKADVQRTWVDEQRRLLHAAKVFYIQQNAI
ncbi:DNase I-like protein [Pluteus cervinus]|uniref:DNase I-like protein n=1 Tax=Pluteus cervinus TaxID=181527 RepID=A0ACD3AEW4_9AGAR|nr:DNase I-like protein [Pluteus cervinus]